MSEHPTWSEWNGMILFAPDGNAATPPRLGRKWDARESVGTEDRNPSLRPNEMSQHPTASDWNGMLLFASEGTAAAPHRLGR
jgi:hypothetical protein